MGPSPILFGDLYTVVFFQVLEDLIKQEITAQRRDTTPPLPEREHIPVHKSYQREGITCSVLGQSTGHVGGQQTAVNAVIEEWADDIQHHLAQAGGNGCPRTRQVRWTEDSIAQRSTQGVRDDTCEGAPLDRRCTTQESTENNKGCPMIPTTSSTLLPTKHPCQEGLGVDETAQDSEERCSLTK